jgi:hypothetical protein
MSGQGGAPSEEELRAAYEAELKQVRVEQILLEHVVTMINLGMRRTGLAPGTEDERDPEQVRLAIEAVRALMPLLEQTAPAQVGQIRAALSQLQLGYVRIGGQPGPEAPAGGQPGSEAPPGGGPPGGGPPSGAPGGPGAPPGPGARPDTPGGGQGPGQGGAGPAQRSGRLWIPGQ